MTDYETIGQLLLTDNPYIIRVCSQKEVTEGLLLEWMCDNRIQYSLDDKLRGSDSLPWYGEGTRKCCFCPDNATRVFHNGYHRDRLTRKRSNINNTSRYLNTYCNTHHSKYSYRYCTSVMCDKCLVSANVMADDNRKLIAIAIRILSGVLNKDICDIIEVYFKRITKYYRTLIRMVEC